MDKQTQQLMNKVNRTVIQFRSIYSVWSKQHNMSYNEMLVLYTIRDEGFCTQKQICDNYLLPRQTMNNVFSKMRKAGIIDVDMSRFQGKEKVFILTEKGKACFLTVMDSLNSMEEQAAETMGEEKIKIMIELIKEFDKALNTALNKNGG